ncbi:hypothetical protein FOZ63_002456, partial [Perkinsus olseni]
MLLQLPTITTFILMARCSCLEMRGGDDDDTKPVDLMSFDEPGDLYPKQLHPNQDLNQGHHSALLPGKLDVQRSRHLAFPSSSSRARDFKNEPSQLYEGGGYMVRFSKPQAGKDLSVEELKCPSDENQEASAVGYIFPQGLQNFTLTFEDHEHIRIKEQAFRVKQTGSLADSLRFLYSSTAEDGRKAPPEDAAALLQHIAKALCTMVKNDIKNDPDYYLLKGVSFMKLNLYEGRSGQPPTRAVIV